MRARVLARLCRTFILGYPILVLATSPAAAQPRLGAEQYVQADGADIVVPGYSVPSLVHWNNDGLKDLVVGEGSGTLTPRVRVYLNVGSPSEPSFSSYFYAQSEGSDLTTPGNGCMGLFPRTVYWDADGCKDLLIGQALGAVSVFLNIGTEDSPSFDGGSPLRVGPPDFKTDIDVGNRATPAVVDFNGDGRKDLVIGAYDGKIHIFLNEGTDDSPDFRSETFVQDSGADLTVPSGRSSPVVADLDGDGRKDLLLGNTEGELLFYSNTATDSAPGFSGYVPVEADGVAIDLPGTPRSRPFLCYWNDDGLPDVLIGAGDGKVRLYQGLPAPGDYDADGDVDVNDAAVLISAIKGPNQPASPVDSDLDGDTDCDLADFAVLAVNFTGPTQP